MLNHDDLARVPLRGNAANPFTLSATCTTHKAQTQKSRVFCQESHVFCTNPVVLSDSDRLNLNPE
jgi:hypothetical protein